MIKETVIASERNHDGGGRRACTHGRLGRGAAACRRGLARCVQPLQPRAVDATPVRSMKKTRAILAAGATRAQAASYLTHDSPGERRP